MKKQFRLWTVAIVLGTGAAFGTQQEQAPARPQHHQMDPDRQVKMMTRKLNLTADQQQQMLPVLTDRQQQFESIRNDSSLSADDRREKMRSVREDSEIKIKAILTDSQKQKYEKMQQEMRERMQQRRQSDTDAPQTPQL